MKSHLQIFMLLMVSVLTMSMYAQTPVAQYGFSGNAKDGSTNANHALVNGAHLTSDRFGWSGKAFHFDGEQSSVTASNSAALNTGTTSISFWVNPSSFPAQGEVFILSNGGWQQRWKISLPGHGKPVFTTHSGGNCCSDMDSGKPLELNKWTHLVMVHDGSKDIMYVNGVKANEKAAAGNLDATTHPLGIGYDPIDKNYYFNGALDEVAVYGEALSETQVAALYAEQNTAPVVPSGIVASYDLDNSGKDNSAFENHANLENASTATDRFGYGHSAVSCDGKSTSINADNGNQLNSSLATISFWVKPHSFPASGEVFILSNGGWQERWKVSLPSHGKPVFTTHSGGACCSDLDSGTPLALNAWTHVAMVHDGTSDIIYLNGQKVNQKNAAGNLDATVYPLGIGWNPIDVNGWFDGAIDDVTIYNQALNAGEITALYTAEAKFNGNVDDLVASYSLNGDGHDGSQFANEAHPGKDAQAVASRFGRGSNAMIGGAVADNSIALQSDYMTIGFWVKPNAFPGNGEVYLISNGGWQERLKVSLPSHGKPVFTTHSGGACCSDLDSGTPLALNAWTYVTMVHDGAQDIIYFNGARVNQKNVTGTLDKTSHHLGIGFDAIDGGSYFDGAMDDVEIYNRALNDAEILALYDAQKEADVIGGNLVANYEFKGNGHDATDYSNDANGYIASKDRFGKSNSAAGFNGKSTEVSAANSTQLNSPLTTVSFWANPRAYAANGENFIMSFGGWQERWKISLPTHGKPVWTTNHSNGISDMDSGDGHVLPLNAWTHVVMVHDGANDLIYFNGSQVATKAVAGTLNNTTKPLGIGYNAVDGGNWFDGALDEVQIYNNALSAIEIKALYDAQSKASSGGDEEAPCAPLNLEGFATFNNVDLHWRLAKDNIGVVAYNVYTDGVLTSTIPDNAIHYHALTPLTDFVFAVTAVDAAGNESMPSTTKVTTGQDEAPDTSPPTPPGNLKGSPSFNSVLLSWDASTDDRKVDGYIVWVDGVYYDSLTANALSILVSGLDPSTPYSFEVAAFDLAGNLSALSELTVTTTKPLVTAEPGLIAHYPLDGNANDATPYLNHGAAGGDVKYETANHANGNMNAKFDGDRDSILVPNAVQLLSDYTTLAFWIRVDAVNLADAESYVIDFGHWDQRCKVSLPQHLKIVWTTNSNNVQFPNFISDMDSGDGNEMVKGFWWYVTMVHDGTDDVVYVNGIETKRKPALGKLNTTTRPLCFGSNPVEGKQYFNGALDDIKIYNKALTSSEISTLFNTGTTGVDDINLADVSIGSITPNPATNMITINHKMDVNQTVSIRIFDMLGRQVGDKQVSNSEMRSGSIPLDVALYNAGMYQINFVSSGKSIGNINFVKQ
jgi:chitodextrinase